MENKIKLKGGSLSNTYLIKNGDVEFVRKEISLKHDREYGFQRWYSQYKKLQRYSELFPNIFPRIIDMGVDEDTTYFDIEYIKNSKTSFEFICDSTENKVDEFFDELVKILNTLHLKKLNSYENTINLYLYEEVVRRLEDALKNKKFKEFTKNENIIFNGEVVQSFILNLEEYENISKKFYTHPEETFTHGNLTLENILYVDEEKKIILIDPYEENIIDSDLSEISQLLQSSNSLYELYNSNTVNIINNNVSIDINIPNGLRRFNQKLVNYINNKYTTNQIITIKVLEISQFIRMLPFKVESNTDKAIFFYSLASKLLQDLILTIKNDLGN